MAHEVRTLPPLLLALLAILLASPPPISAQTNKSQPTADDLDAIEAKARLLQELDQQLDHKRAELAREELNLAALREAVEAATVLLADERQKLETMQEQLAADIARREILVDERLKQIAQVYGAMKPREAAQALEGMNDEMAVAILERLPGRTVGKFFDLMPKERVRELTARLEQGLESPGD